MEKKFVSFWAVVLIVVISFLTVNCETGLGPAVDVQKPSVAITYPPSTAAIREAFVLAGTCEDDQGVDKIVVSILNSENKPVAGYESIQAKIAADGKSWSITLNEGTDNPDKKPPLIPEKTFPLKDGSYTIQVQAIDKANRQSDIVARSFDIDNTAPILVLNKPMAIGTNKPTSYGRIFKLAGDANDDHNIKVSFYFKKAIKPTTDDGPVIFDPNAPVIPMVEDMNVSSMSSDAPLILARYYDENKIDSEEKRTLTENYKRIYGLVSTTTKNDTNYYYGGIRLMDSAKVYQDPAEAENNSRGNETDSYIINTDELSKTLNSIGTDGIKAGDIKKILNGTATYGADVNATVATVLSAPGNSVSCTSSGDVTDNSNVFKLNPDNNPTWSIANYTIKEKDTTYAKDGEGYRDYNLGAAHTLTITPNTDGDYVVPKNIELYCVQVVKNAAGGWDQKGNRIYLLKKGEWTDESSNEAVSLGGLSLEGLGAGEYYRFYLEGLDREDNEYVKEDDRGYGLKVASSETAPTLLIDENSKPCDNKGYFKLSELKTGIKITGTIVEANKKLGYIDPNGGTDYPPIRLYQWSVTGPSGADLSALTIEEVSKNLKLWKTDDGEEEIDLTDSSAWNKESMNWRWELEIKADIDEKSGTPPKPKYPEGNYTFTFQLAATNRLGEGDGKPENAKGRTLEPKNADIYYGDSKPPVPTFTNPDFLDGNNIKTAPKVFGNSDGNSGNGASNQLSGKDAKRTFTLQGKWKDESGSGMGSLYYYLGKAAGMPTSNDTTTGWKEATEYKETENRTKNGLTWSVEIPNIEEGEDYVCAVWATDMVGNKSGIHKVPNIMFDFGAPTIEISTGVGDEKRDLLQNAYSTNNKNLVVNVKVDESYELDSPTPVTITATKGGSLFNNTSTFVVGSTAGWPVNGGTCTVTLKAGDAALSENNTEGDWIITVTAKDKAGRETTKSTKTITIDTTPPVLKEDTTYKTTMAGKTINGTADATTAEWITTSIAPAFVVNYVEKGKGGAPQLYYKIGTGAEQGPLGLISKDSTNGIYQLPGNSIEFKQEGENTITFWAVDPAGNKSAETTYKVFIDTNKPELEYTGFAQKKTGATSVTGTDANTNVKVGYDVEVTVKATDTTPGSGIKEVKFSINDTEVNTTAGSGYTVTDDGSGNYTLKIPASKLATEGNYKVSATVTDNANNTSTLKEFFTAVVDKTPPTLTVSAIPNVINEKNSAISESTTGYVFTVSGTWNDAVSGVKTLYYSEDKGKTWIALTEDEAPSGSTTNSSWSHVFEISKNDQAVHSYWFKAEDMAGNETAEANIIKYEGVRFDFSVPTISIEVSKELTNLKDAAGTTDEDLVITIKAHDDNKLKTSPGEPITLVLKKGETAQSEVSGKLTIAKSTASDNQNSTYIVTIKNPGDHSFDGNWTVEATANEDLAGAHTAVVKQTKTFRIDTTPPTLNDDFKVNDVAFGSKWYKSYSFSVDGTCSDNLSGVTTVYYWLKKATDTTSSLDISKPTDSISISKPIVTKGAFRIPTDGFEAGTNYIYFWAKDEAGNVSNPPITKEIRVDELPPGATLDTTPTAEYKYRTLTNDAAPLVFKGTLTDDASGAYKFTLTLGNKTLTLTSATTDTVEKTETVGSSTLKIKPQGADKVDGKYVREWEATIENGVFGGLLSAPLTYVIEDSAGNKNAGEFVSIKIDKVAPTTKFKSPSASSTVNKVIIVEGSTDDGMNTIDSVELKYKIGTGSFTSFVGGLEKDADGNPKKDTDGCYVWIPASAGGSGGIVIPDGKSSLNEWKIKINTVEAFGGTNAAQDKNVTLGVVAKDMAGNVAAPTASNTKEQVTFTVDQNTDRPVITLTTGVSEVNSTNYIASNKLEGSISDDDGDIKEFYVSVSAIALDVNGKRTSGGTQVVPNNGVWLYTLPTGSDADGAKTLYFYVEDNEGGIFSWKYNGSGNTPTDDFGNPYFVYKVNGIEQEKQSLKNTFNYTQDTAAPLVTKVEWVNGGDSEAFPLASNTSAVIPWLGGTTKNSGSLKIYATDGNGISAIRIEVSGSVAGSTITKGFTTGTTETISGTEYKKVGTLTNDVWTIPLNDTTFDFAHWSSAEYTVSVTATDNSGQEGSQANNGTSDVAANYKFKLDFTPPSVTMNVAPSATIITSATITTTFSDTVDGFDGVGLEGVTHYWAIPKKTETESTVAWQEVGNVTTLTTKLAWEDVSKYSNSDYATENTTTGLWEVPIWFKVVDALGNTQTVEKVFTIDKESSYATAEINSPEDGSKVGSTTKLSGIASISGNIGDGAIGEASIREVRVQIDADGDGDYDGDDFAILSGNAAVNQFVGKDDAEKAKNQKSANSKWKLWSETKAKFKNTEEYQTGESTPARLQSTATDWYILADVNGNNWGLTVPTNLFGFSCKVTGGDRPHVKYRVKALGQMNKNKAGTDGLYAMEDYDVSGTSTGNKHIKDWPASSSLTIAGVDQREIVIDSQAPQIKDIYLVQYTDDDPTKAVKKSRAYKDGMYIGPGDWYITANLEDETALDSYTLSVISNNTGVAINDVSEEDISLNNDETKKAIKPTQITRNSTTSGKIELELSVVDNSSKTGQKNITINIDVTPPVIPTDAKGLILYDSFSKQLSEDVVIENSDGTFKLGNAYGNAEKNLQDEGGSNISYVAFWFERQPKSTGVKRVFNPMIAHGDKKVDGTYSNQTELTDTETANKVFINDDGLAVMHITGLTRSSDTTITLPSLNESITQNIRYGGLVQIGGSYVLINKVDGNVLTLSEAADVKITDAYFVFAQIVNDSSSGADTYGNVGATDGDGMQENLLNKDYGSGKSGWQWYGNIKSDYIPDGPIIVHVTAIDGAGNIAKAQVKTKIANNRPRITKVMVASDWNNNGTYDVRAGKVDGKTVTIDDIKNTTIASEATRSGTEFGEFVYYSTIDKDNSEYNKIIGLSDATLQAYDGTIFKVPNKLCIIPQFTGGNNNSIQYTWEVVSPSSATLTPAEKVVEFKGHTKVTTNSTGTPLTELVEIKSSITGDTGNKLTTGETDPNFVAKDLQYKGAVELTVAQLEKHDDGTKPIKCLAFTFWDATDETTQGVDSLNALLKVPVILNVNDKTKPRPAIKPFIWTGNKNTATEINNNVYIDGSIKGHIELEADWKKASGYDPTATSGLGDADPKVSGQIIIRGTAYDDIQLKNIGIDVENMFMNPKATILEYNSETQEWTTTAVVNAGGGKVMSAKAENITADQSGHLVSYEVVINTEGYNGAVLDKAIRVYATDWKDNYFDANTGYHDVDGNYYESGTTGYDANNLTKQTTEAANTAYYKVDVVPYVTNIYTGLSKLKNNNWSIHSRTAQGHYSVASTETLYVYGYNLSGCTAKIGTSSSATFISAQNSNDSNANCYTMEVSGFNSGVLEVTNGDIAAVNNLNYNDAYGTAYETAPTVPNVGDKEIYDNFYNRQPNGDNNNNLTDDLYLDVWGINPQAARPRKGTLLEPVMKINLNDSCGNVGFAFVNGPDAFSMGTKDESYVWKQYNYADYRYVSFAYDENGNAWGTAAGLDTEPSYPLAGRFTLFSSLWTANDATTSKDANYNGRGGLRIDSMGVPRGISVQGTTENTGYPDTYRFRSPSITTAVHGSNTAIYLAYVDVIQGQIRFRQGERSSTSTSRSEFGDFTDNNGLHWNSGSSKLVEGEVTNADWGGNGNGYKLAFEVKTDKFSLIAGKDYQTNYDTNYIAGEYVAIDVVPGSSVANDVVVAVWFDGTDCYYSYIKNPASGKDLGDGSSASPASGVWRMPIKIFENGGEHCAIAVDGLGGIHIAGYDISNADLKYAYLSAYNATPAGAVTVDGYDIVGTRISIDTHVKQMKVGNANVKRGVPVISYYSPSTQKPRYATLADVEEGEDYNYAAAGINSSNQYTGAWEVRTVPASGRLQDDRINIGVWKYLAENSAKTEWRGLLRDSRNVGTTSCGTTNGTCYGNGTKNPILGYATRNGASYYIETAQMK